MFLCPGPWDYLIGAAALVFGFSWLYWYRRVNEEVNKTLPLEQRVTWKLSERPPRKRRFWTKDEALFPESRSRRWAMWSLALALLTPPTAMIICILLGSGR